MKQIFLYISIAFLFHCALALEIMLNEEQLAEQKIRWDNCAKEWNLKQEDVEKLRKQNFEDTKDRSKCFLKCLLEDVGTFKDGNIVPETVEALLSPLIGGCENVRAIGQQCNHLRGFNQCETAYQIFVCYSYGERAL